MAEDTMTQYQHVYQTLGIQLECSSIPQFKPRIERSYGTLQGRLPFDIEEIEAEIVSYLVCSRWNLEKEPIEYISWHISQENLSKISVNKIIKVADKIENTFLERFK